MILKPQGFSPDFNDHCPIACVSTIKQALERRLQGEQNRESPLTAPSKFKFILDTKHSGQEVVQGKAT